AARVAVRPARQGRFVFTDTAPTQGYTLSLHDALPISVASIRRASWCCAHRKAKPPSLWAKFLFVPRKHRRCHELPVRFALHCLRSEEHTSELQSRENLVCRLLLEKKKS